MERIFFFTLDKIKKKFFSITKKKLLKSNLAKLFFFFFFFKSKNFLFVFLQFSSFVAYRSTIKRKYNTKEIYWKREKLFNFFFSVHNTIFKKILNKIFFQFLFVQKELKKNFLWWELPKIFLLISFYLL